MSRQHAANVIAQGMRFHQGLGRFGYLGDSAYDPSQLPYLPTPLLSPVDATPPVPVSPGVTTAVVQSSTWPSWGTYAAIGGGILALIWLSNRRR